MLLGLFHNIFFRNALSCKVPILIILGCPVTLVEENRDLLGNGTTGLVSWQGAVALTCWATESQIFNQKV